MDTKLIDTMIAHPELLSAGPVILALVWGSRKLSALDHRVLELTHTLVGVSGNNGLASEVKQLKRALEALDERLARQRDALKELEAELKIHKGKET